MQTPDKKYVAKSTIAKNFGWKPIMVSDFLGRPDYVVENPHPGGHEIQLYNVSEASLFISSTEAVLRKNPPSRKAINPSEETLAKWQSGSIANPTEALSWCLQQIQKANVEQAMSVARQLDPEKRDAFYGLARKNLQPHQKRALLRLEGWEDLELRRHLIRAIRENNQAETLSIARHPVMRNHDNASHMATAHRFMSSKMFQKLGDYLKWNESHADLLYPIIIRNISQRSCWKLAHTPPIKIPANKLDKCLEAFIQKTPRHDDNQHEDLTAWLLRTYNENEILEALSRVGNVATGSMQKREPVNFMKLFHDFSKRTGRYSETEIKEIQKALSKNQEQRGQLFRSIVLRNIIDTTVKTPQIAKTTQRPKM